MTIRDMDESVKRLEIKIERMEKDVKSRREDHQYLQWNFIGFAFITFVIGLLAWQVLGDAHPITIAALMVASLALVGLNLVWMFWKRDMLKKQKEKQT